MWAKAPQHIQHNEASARNTPNAAPMPMAKNEGAASNANGISGYQLKIPRIATGKLDEDELKDVNRVFVKYSADKVHLERKANGKLYLKANSANDVFKLATYLVTLKKSSPAAIPPGDRGGVAIAGGVIGIVALVFSLGPFVSYAAFLLGIVAIILGAIGLHSGRRGWAIVGIVLGVLAILFAGVLGIGIYTLVLHI